MTSLKCILGTESAPDASREASEIQVESEQI